MDNKISSQNVVSATEQEKKESSADNLTAGEVTKNQNDKQESKNIGTSQNTSSINANSSAVKTNSTKKKNNSKAKHKNHDNNKQQKVLKKEIKIIADSSDTESDQSDEIQVDEVQKAKNEIELINIFNNLEAKLINILQGDSLDITGDNKDNVKTNIKSYIEKVNLASKIFDEYENVAKLIVQFNDAKEDDQESIEISKKVIESRGDNEKSINEKDLLKKVQDIEKETNGLDKVEIEANGDSVIVKRKKDAVKEL